MGERFPCKESDVGSNPTGSTNTEGAGVGSPHCLENSGDSAMGQGFDAFTFFQIAVAWVSG